MIESHHRALGFGLGIALAAVCAVCIGSGFHFQIVRPGPSFTLVNGGAWAYLSLALVAFPLSFTIWRQMVTAHPPTAGQSIGLALVTSMAIGVVICLVTTISVMVRTSPGHWPFALLLTLIFVWPYCLFTTALPLLVLVSAWTAAWRYLSVEETGPRTFVEEPLEKN